MPLELANECCDADAYQALGAACADHLTDCWHGLRPVGAVFYFSLPFRFGLGAEWTIVLNAVLVIVSAIVGFRAMSAVSPRGTPLSRAVLALAIPVAHAAFMGGTIRNTLSDGPSACAALIAMWALVLAMKGNKPALYAVAGGALGIATILRIFYLYPACITAACLVGLALIERRGRVASGLFCVTLALPILLQFGATYAHVHSFGFIDPASVAYGERLHFQTDAYGYDTLLPARGHYYSAPECFRDASSMGDAIQKHEWDEVLCLVVRRQWFYFGSYVTAGRTYLAHASDRHFSVLFLVVHVLATVLGLWWAFSRRARARVLLVPVLFFGASLAEASIIIPEARFLMAIHVALWMFAIAGAHELVLRFAPVAGVAEGLTDENPTPFWPGTVVPFFVSQIARLRSWWTAFTLRSLATPAILMPAGAIAATLVVNGMALTSDFQDEDLRHIYESRQLDTVPYLVRPYGNHFCAFFRLTVMVLHGLFGANALGYFVVVVLTHCVHVALLYGIIRALTQSRFIAAAFAALWGSAPAFQGTLQWFAAYSHMLGATAVVWPLWELARAREENRAPTAWALVRISVALILGSATELTGSLSAVAFPFLAFVFLPPKSEPLRTGLWLLPAALASVLLVTSFTASGNDWVLAFFQWGPTLAMFAQLVVYGVGVLILGPFLTIDAAGQTWLFGASTGAAIIVGAVVFLPAFALVVMRIIRGDADERRSLLAAIAFAGLMYAAVAAGRSGLTFGHALSWMATKDRYHYDASVGLVIAIAVAVANTWPRLSWPSEPRTRAWMSALAGAWLVSGSFAAHSTYLQGAGRQEWTRDWEDLADGSVQLLLQRMPRGGMLFVRNDLFRPAGLIYAMNAPHTAFPGIGAYWIVAHDLEGMDGRAIRFVEMDLDLLRKIRKRTRPDVAAMFVSPGQVESAHGEIRTLEADAPPEVARFLATSQDPMVGKNDHDLANRLRRLLSEMADRPPAPFGPPPIAALPDPPGILDPPPRLPTKEELQRRALERSIRADPKAREALRQAILADPKKVEELRKALQEQQRAED